MLQREATALIGDRGPGIIGFAAIAVSKTIVATDGLVDAGAVLRFAETDAVVATNGFIDTGTVVVVNNCYSRTILAYLDILQRLYLQITPVGCAYNTNSE